jgi:copper chaperone CopZ
MVIEGELEDQLGVKAACNYARQMVEVEYDPARVGIEQIRGVIEEQGYQVVS